MKVERGQQVVYVDPHENRQLAEVTLVLDAETGLVELLRRDGVAEVSVMPRGTLHAKSGHPIDVQCYYGAELTDDERLTECATNPADELAAQRLALLGRERELELAELRAKEAELDAREEALRERTSGGE